MGNADDTTKFFVFLCDADIEEPTFIFMLHNGVWYEYFKNTDTCSVHEDQYDMYHMLHEKSIVEVKCE